MLHTCHQNHCIGSSNYVNLILSIDGMYTGLSEDWWSVLVVRLSQFKITWQECLNPRSDWRWACVWGIFLNYIHWNGKTYFECGLDYFLIWALSRVRIQKMSWANKHACSQPLPALDRRCDIVMLPQFPALRHLHLEFWAKGKPCSPK